MSPVRIFPAKWSVRPSDNKEQIEPYRCYYFLCEGKNTESWYFSSFINKRKELGIKPTIHIHLLQKEGSDENLSSPKKLLELIDKAKKDEIDNFDEERDKCIIVFDADIFESIQTGYEDILDEADKNNYILGVTNPSFELFLLLHYERAYEDIIEKESDKIIKNDWVGKKRYINYRFCQLSGINPKKNSKVGELVDNINTAIQQEKKINNNIQDCKGKITSNIGCIIEAIIKEGNE